MNVQASKDKKLPIVERQQCCSQLDSALDPLFFKALSDPTRIQVLLCLVRCCDPQTVTDVARCCSVDMSVVSRHLATLRDAGVLSVEKQGRQMRYAVRYRELARRLRSLAEAVDRCCADEPAGC